MGAREVFSNDYQEFRAISPMCRSQMHQSITRVSAETAFGRIPLCFWIFVSGQCFAFRNGNRVCSCLGACQNLAGFFGTAEDAPRWLYSGSSPMFRRPRTLQILWGHLPEMQKGFSAGIGHSAMKRPPLSPRYIIAQPLRHQIASAPLVAWKIYGITASLTFNVAFALLFLYWRMQ
jgi:hypothetical protein